MLQSVPVRQLLQSVPVRRLLQSVPVRRLLQSVPVRHSQTVGELVTVEFVTVRNGLAALQLLKAPNSCPLVVAPGGS